MKLSKVCNLLASFMIVVIVFICAPLVVPKLFGYELYGILSGSMEPTYPVGSVVYVQPVNANEIQINDVITFQMAADSQVVATHRVIAKDDQKQVFTTKGDHNDNIDSSPVSYKRLIGKTVFCIPYLGYISAYVQSSAGLIALVAVMILVFVLWFLSDYFKNKEKHEMCDIGETEKRYDELVKDRNGGA